MQLETQIQNPPPAPPETDLIPLNIIRTETALSKLPVHNLAKKGRVDIQITKLSPRGEIELRWEVSYSERYGQARQLAYKLDTIVIDQRVDEIGRPLPERIRLGSLNQIAQELGLDPNQGPNARHLRRAFLQNASAFITAKVKYRGNDGTEHTFEAGFTRYTVVFTGHKFSNGTKADAVYIELHPRYREVLNNAPMRPLNLDYKKALPPAAQRFYEIVSYKIFAALKNNLPIAKLPYSEYCTFSAQQRYFDYDHFKKQMYKIHRPHLQSGYIVKVHYDHATDEEGRPDWVMCYIPGPRAKAEYHTFTKKKAATIDAAVQPTRTIEAGERRVVAPTPRPAKPPEKTATPPAEQEADAPLFQKLISRGITEKRAKKLLEALTDHQHVLDQLEWGDYLIRSQPEQFKNPAGFYVYLVTNNVLPPPNFETSRQRKLREDRESTARAKILERQQLEDEYDDYRRQETDRYIRENLSQAEVERITQAKRKQIGSQFKNFALISPENVEKLLWGALRAEIAPRAPFLTFSEYREQRSRQPNLFEGQPGQGSEPPVPSEEALKAAYQNYCREQAQVAIDALDMMERGRRRKAARSYLLNEHPNHGHFQGLITDERYEEFYKLSEEQLIEDTLQTLALPTFEVWRQTAVVSQPPNAGGSQGASPAGTSATAPVTKPT